MANYPRSLIVVDGSVFHVTLKCHNNDWLLGSEFAKELYYELLIKYKNYYGVEFFSYCFMDNHPHLTGRCKSQKLFSDFFRVVHSCFSKQLNKELKRKGQTVMDRFKSPTMQSDENLMNVIIYNDLNPYRTVKQTHPKKYKWSSYQHYAYGKEDRLLTDPECYKALGKTSSAREKNYRFMINEIIKNDHKAPKCPYRNESNFVCFIGNPQWVEKRFKLLRKIVNKKRKEWQDRHEEFLGLSGSV